MTDETHYQIERLVGAPVVAGVRASVDFRDWLAVVEATEAGPATREWWLATAAAAEEE